MDAGSILSAVITLALAGIGGLGWLFKLHGDQRVLREKLYGEIELRKAMGDRLNGFESRVYEKLEEIIDKLSRKADR
jgi:hypothetical protein